MFMTECLQLLAVWSPARGTNTTPTGANGTVTLAPWGQDQARVFLNWYINDY